MSIRILDRKIYHVFYFNELLQEWLFLETCTPFRVHQLRNEHEKWGGFELFIFAW